MKIVNMNLQNAPFEQIKKGVKSVEIRLFDEKRKTLSVNDKIIFTNAVTGETLTTVITSLTKFNSFNELFSSTLKQRTGFTTETVEQAIDEMRKYYSAQSEKLYGVLAIGFTVIQ